MMPLGAWAVINEEWQFYIPLIDLTYKPWRLFIAACGLPAFLAALALLILPESPRFVLSKGNKQAAYDILKRMNRCNNGKRAQFEEFDVYDEDDDDPVESRALENNDEQISFLESVWNQTAPLFKPPYLKTTILLCTIQFGTFLTSNGFFMFFAEILNTMSNNLYSFTDQKMMMCDIINMKPANLSSITNNSTQNAVSCEFHDWKAK